MSFLDAVPSSNPMKISPRNLPRNSLANFDRVARVYRWAEYLALGPLLRRTREQFLPALTHTEAAWVLGDGDGRFAAALLREAPGCRVWAVDSSSAMLERLRCRCLRDGTTSRLTTLQASVLDIPAIPGCDLITTHFLLDCLTQGEVDSLAIRLAGEVTPRCRWVISEFGRPRGRVGGWLGAAYVRLLYFAFGLLTGLRVQRLPDPQTALRAAGFVRLERVERLRGLIYAEIWHLA